MTPLNLNEIDVKVVDFEKLNEIKEKEDKAMEIDGTVKEKIKRKNDEKKKTKLKLKEQLIENGKKIEQMKKKKNK